MLLITKELRNCQKSWTRLFFFGGGGGAVKNEDCGPLFLGLENNGTIAVTFSRSLKIH